MKGIQIECHSSVPPVPAYATDVARSLLDPAPALIQLNPSDLPLGALPTDSAWGLTNTIDWSGLGGVDSFVPTPTPPLRSLEKRTSVTASVTSGQGFQRQVQSDSIFVGGLPNNMPVLNNGGNGAITLTFCQPITAFATYVQVRYHCSHIRPWRSFWI